MFLLGMVGESLMHEANRGSGIVLVAVSAASFGVMPVFAQMAYAGGTSTVTLLFLRFSVGALCMGLFAALRKLPVPSGRDTLASLLLGAIGYVGQSYCYFTALRYASASVVALLLYTYPMMVMASSVLWFHEVVSRRNIVALACAILGAVVILGAKGHASMEGVVLSLASAVIYTGYILVSARVVRKGREISSSAYIMLGAALVYGVMNGVSGFSFPHDASSIGAVLSIALVSTVLAFWSFFTGMEKIGPSTAAMVSTVEPVVTVLASVLMLGESLPLRLVGGGVLVLASLVLNATTPSPRGKDAG